MPTLDLYFASQASVFVMDPSFFWNAAAVRRALNAVSAPLVLLVQPSFEQTLLVCSEAQLIGEVEYLADVPDAALCQLEQVDPSRQLGCPLLKPVDAATELLFRIRGTFEVRLAYHLCE